MITRLKSNIIRHYYWHYQICYWHCQIMRNPSFFHSPNYSHPFSLPTPKLHQSHNHQPSSPNCPNRGARVECKFGLVVVVNGEIGADLGVIGCWWWRTLMLLVQLWSHWDGVRTMKWCWWQCVNGRVTQRCCMHRFVGEGCRLGHYKGVREREREMLAMWWCCWYGGDGGDGGTTHADMVMAMHNVTMVWEISGIDDVIGYYFLLINKFNI